MLCNLLNSYIALSWKWATRSWTFFFLIYHNFHILNLDYFNHSSFIFQNSINMQPNQHVITAGIVNLQSYFTQILSDCIRSCIFFFYIYLATVFFISRALMHEGKLIQCPVVSSCFTSIQIFNEESVSRFSITPY